MGEFLVARLVRSMRTNFWCFFLFFSAVFVSLESKHMNNFVSVNYLPDGQIETRVHYNGISAKETSVSNRNTSGLMFRELTDGRRYIQLVYNNGSLKDCQYGRRKEQIQKFLNLFNNMDKNQTISTSSLVIENLDNSKALPKNVRRWFNYPKLRKLCRQKKRKFKRKLKKEEMILQMNLDRTKKKGRSSLGVMPGTLWCGDHDQAPRYNALGMFAETDKCCRRHDYCKQNIYGFSRKYDFLNRSPFTISHCFCDASFRACLKLVDTTDSNIVGKIFFNLVQTKCFVIKRKRVCAEWEGTKCVKKKVVKRAVIKQNLSY